jgi:hypothetical protein
LAETHDFVKLSVRLFIDNAFVVVEIQRTCGCSFSFREAAKSLLRSAKGLERMLPRKRFAIPTTLPHRSRAEQQGCFQDDVRIAFDMLRSNRSDCKLLALESLEKMTQPCENADVAAKAILTPENLKQLLAFSETDADIGVSELEESQSNMRRRKVLAILANSLATLNQSDRADVLSITDNGLNCRSFLEMLHSTLDDASARPHDACEAARCLQYLSLSKDVQESLAEMSTLEVVSSACSAGSHSHHRLETESKILLDQLRKVHC